LYPRQRAAQAALLAAPPPLFRRSAFAAIVVGTVLVAINHGTTLAMGAFPPVLAWEIALTYLVPSCVVTQGTLSSSRGCWWSVARGASPTVRRWEEQPWPRPHRTPCRASAT